MKKKLISLISVALLLSSNTALASSVSVTSEGFSAADAPEGSMLIAALYDNNMLKAVSLHETEGTALRSFDEEFLGTAEADGIIKVFLWSAKTLAPICGSVSAAVSELTEAETAAPMATAAPTDEQEKEDNIMTITIGEQTFTAALYDNETAQAFAEMLPMTIDMTAFSGNNE